MTEQRVVRTDTGAVATLLLDRPEKLNALDTRAFDELEEHLDELDAAIAAGDVRVVVLRGAGRAFCAGADLATARAPVPGVPRRKSEVLQRLAALPLPVVAVVHGHCVGGGLELALAADLIVAADDASLSDAHARHDLVPAWGLTQRLPRRVGAARAKLMMFTCRAVDAAEAHRIGLVDLVAPTEELDGVVAALVADLTAVSTRTQAEVKALLTSTDGLPLVAGLAAEHGS
jgi:enoyl-CoA hydratase